MIIEPTDALGVWPLLLQVSTFAAKERGSDQIESRDLVKAIYIADLEHVSGFWNDWEGFERFVKGEKLAHGGTATYINRIVYLVRIELAMRDSAEGCIELTRISPMLQEVVVKARKLARESLGDAAAPSSQELLYAVCSLDHELSESLQRSGLQLSKLASAIKK